MKNHQDICLAMLVRDESTVIGRCLRSLKPIISSYYIIDTGSLDDTSGMILQELSHIEGSIVRQPFTSFGVLREDLYHKAAEIAEYVLFLDADETLQESNTPLFEPPLPDIGLVEIAFKSHVRRLPRLFRIGLNINFTGYVYERPVYAEEYCVETLSGLRLCNHQDGYRSKQAQQAQSDMVHLLADLDGYPRDVEILLQLAEVARHSGQSNHAKFYYQQCIEMTSDPQSLWHAYYMYGKLSRQTGADPQYSMQAFMQAYELFPNRAEPLFGIVDCLRTLGKDAAANAILEVATTIPVPTNVNYFEPACYGDKIG